MKHLFYIHSYITYIVASSIMLELNLQPNSVIFIYGRGFRYCVQKNVKVVELPSFLGGLSKIPSYGERFLIIKRFREIAELDKLIDDLMHGERFIAYLPLTKNYLMQLLTTHPLCQDVVFIEEGLLTYTGKFNKQTHAHFTKGLRGKIARWIRYPNHGNRSFYYRPYRHTRPIPVYMLHEPLDSMGAEIEVRVLQRVVMPPLDPRFKLDNGYLLVIDTIVEDGLTSQDSFLRTLEIFIAKFLKDKTDTLWIRFRPNSPVPQGIIDLFVRNGFQVHVLSEDICVESILYHSQHVSVIGFHSSLLLYGAIWGGNSYSLVNILFSVDPEARAKYWSRLHLPREFYSYVTFLE